METKFFVSYIAAVHFIFQLGRISTGLLRSLRVSGMGRYHWLDHRIATSYRHHCYGNRSNMPGALSSIDPRKNQIFTKADSRMGTVRAAVLGASES